MINYDEDFFRRRKKMINYDEDFYDNQTEFETQIGDFKKSLLNAVKDEYKEKMEELLKENQELQDVKKKWTALKREHNNKMKELDNEKINLERKMKCARLDDLLEGVYKFIYYRAKEKYEKQPKCDKCNQHRQVEFISPLGKKMSEPCKCDERKTTYVVEPFHVCEFRQPNEKNLVVWYEPYNTNSYRYSCSIKGESIITKPVEDYSGIVKKNTFFVIKEECQKYCNYLNDMEKQLETEKADEQISRGTTLCKKQH